MENKIKIENLHKNNIADLSFALGKVYEDIKDYEKSFFYIKKANKLKKNLIKYNIQTDQKVYNQTIHICATWYIYNIIQNNVTGEFGSKEEDVDFH